eukprot:3426748-Prymnesium_polylepis.2
MPRLAAIVRLLGTPAAKQRARRCVYAAPRSTPLSTPCASRTPPHRWRHAPAARSPSSPPPYPPPRRQQPHAWLAKMAQARRARSRASARHLPPRAHAATRTPGSTHAPPARPRSTLAAVWTPPLPRTADKLPTLPTPAVYTYVRWHTRQHTEALPLEAARRRR